MKTLYKITIGLFLCFVGSRMVFRAAAKKQD